MDAPRIQYAKTEDGVSIAYWTLGEGPALVHMSLLVSHVQLEWELDECRRWYERLARDRRLVRYDARGNGLSQRDVGPASPTGSAAELNALANKLGLERIILFGLVHSAPPAIAYAAMNPDRVSHLILWEGYTRAADFGGLPEVQAVRSLMAQDWTFYTEAVAHTLLGWSEGEPARRYAALVREAVSRDFVAQSTANVNEFDVSDLLARVTQPTLLLHRRNGTLPVGFTTSLASGIPNAEVVIVEGESGAPYLGDIEAVARAIDDFLGTAQHPTQDARPPAADVHIILFTDLASSTSLTQRLGDAKAQELVRAHNAIVREALAAHGGTDIKHTGDGIMASFPTASGALECAIAIQRAVAERAEENLQVYVGLNAGEPVAEESDLFGTSVQLARRICDHAEAGQILVSNVVRELAAGKGLLFADTGDVALKGFEDPVRLYEVRWRE